MALPLANAWLGHGRAVAAMSLALLIAASSFLILAPPFQSSAAESHDLHRDIVNSVDGERIMSTIIDLQNFGSRVYFISSMLNASTYIHDRFADLGLWVTYQDFVEKGFPQRNVIGVLNGTSPSAPQYLFGAHYDSMTLALSHYQPGNSTYAPGADDDASGIAATIELANALHHKRFNGTVKFVAFGAEETGLNGSRVFVQKELADGVLYAGTVIMDMIGYRAADTNKAFVFRGNSDNLLARVLGEARDDYGLDLSLNLISGWDFQSSDHYSFWLAGYPSMLVIEELMAERPINPYYHSENDTANHLSEEQMTVITKALLGCFLEFQSPQKEKFGYVEVLAIGAAIVAVVAVAIYLYRLRRWKVVE